MRTSRRGRDTAGHRASERERAALLAEHTPRVAAAAAWLRQVVLDALPDAHEVVYRGWHALGYHHPQAGYLCAVFPRADDVLLGFERGVLLDDPHGLLGGEGRTVRYVRVEVPGDPPAERLVELIDAAVLAGSPGPRDPPRPGA
jgi:Domain of unknown function (DU1801)